jgi:DNA-binding NarL/FixJ family response regulator
MILTPAPTAATKVRIMLVDDHAIVRTGLRAILSHDPRLEIVGEACSAAEAVQFAGVLHPQVILLDFQMPDASGADVCRQLKHHSHPPRIVILSSHFDEVSVFAAMDAGADGYLLKDSDEAVIISGIFSVLEGKHVLAPPIAEVLLGRKKKREPEHKSLLDELSIRERIILSLVAQGMINKEIADKLNLAEKTVRNNVTGILSKLKVERRSQAILLYVKESH